MRKDLIDEWVFALAFFRLPKLNQSNIRVLIFKECDKKGKSLIFDSDAVTEVKENEVITF